MKQDSFGCGSGTEPGNSCRAPAVFRFLQLVHLTLFRNVYAIFGEAARRPFKHRTAASVVPVYTWYKSFVNPFLKNLPEKMKNMKFSIFFIFPIEKIAYIYYT